MPTRFCAEIFKKRRKPISITSKYLHENKDSIEALRIIYNSEDTVITHSMLMDLQDKLLMENRQFSVDIIWKNYKIIDEKGDVDDP